MSDHLYMPNERWLEALKRMRARIASGLKLDAVNSDVTGDKYTHCSWGMCSHDKEQWPESGDHLWPDQFEERGRVAPRYSIEGQVCPLCAEAKHNGCFYECRVFQRRRGRRGKKPLARSFVLHLYDEAIAEFEQRMEAEKVASAPV